MSDITFEKTHALLEKFAEYVMDEVPARREMNTRFERVESDVQETKENVRLILNGMDAQIKQLDIIRTEQVATNAALQRHEKRITTLEEKGTGYGIKDADE